MENEEIERRGPRIDNRENQESRIKKTSAKPHSQPPRLEERKKAPKTDLKITCPP